MLTDSVYQEDHVPTQRERFIKSFRANGLGMFGFWSLLIIVLITLISPWLTPHDPYQQTSHLLQPPSWDVDGSIEYFLGTDDLGRDILSRLMVGGQITFASTFAITVIAAIIGCTIGSLAGMTKGLISSTLNHLLDTVMSIPSLLLAIIFVAFWGSDVYTALFAISVALMPRFIRSTYNAIHQEIEKDYVIASRLDGANDYYLFWNSILPNILPVVIAEFFTALTIAIIDMTALGFLGLGAQGATPEWGAIIGNSVELVFIASWTVILPGLAIMSTVIALSIVGEAARDALNSGVE
jgi:cationic peptide transport system permease protein